MQQPTGQERLVVPGESHIRTVVARICDRFSPSRIIVFGSVARGDAKPGSDLDVLVVFDEVSDRRGLAIAIRRLLADLPVPKDVVVASTGELAEKARSSWHLVGAAVREGRVVFPAPATK